MKVLEVVADPNAIARLLHGARARPTPCPPGQLELFWLRVPCARVDVRGSAGYVSPRKRPR